jgi:hypothetical protein
MKIGIELRTEVSIDNNSLGDTVNINGQSYKVCGYYRGSPAYVMDKYGRVYKVVN